MSTLFHSNSQSWEDTMKKNKPYLKTMIQMKITAILFFLLVPMMTVMGSNLEKEKNELMQKLKNSYSRICNLDDSFLASIGTVVNIFNRNVDDLASDRKIFNFSKLQYSDGKIFVIATQSQSNSNQGVIEREKKVKNMEKKLRSVLLLNSYTKTACKEANIRKTEAEKPQKLEKWIQKLKDEIKF